MTASHHRHVLTRSIASLLAIGALTSTGLAAVWTGAVSNDVNDPANWDVNPAGQNIYIGLVGNPAGPAPYTATLSANLAYAVVDIQVARGGGPAVFNHTAGTAATGGGNWLDVGTDGGTGTYNLANVNTTGGTLTGFGTGSGSVTAERIFVGGVDYSGNGGTGTMRVNTTGTVLANYRFYVGDRGNGTFLMDAGTVAAGNDMEIGSRGGVGVMSMSAGLVNAGTGGAWHFIGRDRDGNAGANGTLNISGGVFNNNYATNRFYVGDGNATGKVAVSGSGTLNTQNGDTFIGNNNNANATPSLLEISGNGIVNTANIFFGNTGKGNLVMTGGTLNSGLTSFGNNGTAVVTVNGPTALVNANGEIQVGQAAAGNGTLNLSSGTVQGNGWIAVGREGATGTVNLSGTGVLRKTGGGGSHIIIGSLGGNGTVNQTGGQMFTDGGGDIFIGENSNGGTWNISAGTGSANALRVAAIGAGNGSVVLSGTGQINAGEVNVGQANGNGTLTMTGGTLINDHLQVGTTNNGNLGKGIINQSGGTVTTATWVAVGLGSTQQAEYNISGGTVSAGGFEVGADSAGLVTLSGTGQINVSGNFEVPTRNGSGIFSVSGGELNTPSFQQGGRDGQVGTGVTNQSGGEVNVSGNLDVQRLNVGTGTYNLSGGTLSVDGAINLNAGTFAFSGGKLTRSNAGVIDFNGNFATLAAAATLKLDADKTFDISGNFNNTAGITLEVNGLGIADQPGAFFTPITGSFPLGFIGGTLSQPGDAFDIAFASVVGFDATFNVAGFGDFTAIRINEDDAFNPQTQSVYWVDEDAGVVTLQYSAVPEPATAGLLGLAGLSLALRRRRKA